MKRVWTTLALLLAFGAASAQTLTFTAETTTGIESVVPVLTWDTQPAADICTASGDWLGGKPVSGTETLAAIGTSATYNMTCDWGDFTATLTWTPPTTNTDGSPLTDLASYTLYYGQVSGSYPNSDIGIPATATSHVVSPLASGDWFFVATAVNVLGVESVFSNETMKTLGIVTNQLSVGITVNPRPSPVTGLAVQ